MLGVLVTFLAVTQASATATPTPTPAVQAPISVLIGGPSHTMSASKRSLSGVAGKIKLKIPEGKSRTFTNESVKELAEGVELTIAKPGRPLAGFGSESGADNEGERNVWKERYDKAVARVSELEAQRSRLENEVTAREREFYAHDDPAYRDGVIKPAWDKALVDLRETEKQLELARKMPDQIKEQARRDGTEPGVFRRPSTLPPQRTQTTGGGTAVATPVPTKRVPPTPTPVVVLH